MKNVLYKGSLLQIWPIYIQFLLDIIPPLIATIILQLLYVLNTHMIKYKHFSYIFVCIKLLLQIYYLSNSFFKGELEIIVFH